MSATTATIFRVLQEVNMTNIRIHHMWYQVVEIFLLTYFPKMKAGLSNQQSVCVCVSVCPPLITFEPMSGLSWNLVGEWRHWRWPRSHIFNLVASAIPKWRTFKLLRRVQRNPLITFEPIGGFGRNLVRRRWHWRWPQLRIIQYRNFNHSKMADV
jgi:hypothetical protein